MLSTGGKVELRDVVNKPLSLVDGKLPEGRFTLYTATVGDVPGFTDEGLVNLRSCGKLLNLTFYGNQRVSDAGIAQLEGTRLQQLFLQECPLLTDKATRSIAAIRGLLFLHLGSPGFTDAGVSALEPLKQLQHVQVKNSTITDQGLAHLAEACPQLTHLAIHGSQDGKRSVRALERFRNLVVAYISGDQLTDDRWQGSMLTPQSTRCISAVR